MARSTRRKAVAATAAAAIRPPATPEQRLGELLGRLARRAGSWGWLSTYERIRRGEAVPAWHRRMVELTAAKRRGELLVSKEVAGASE